MNLKGFIEVAKAKRLLYLVLGVIVFVIAAFAVITNYSFIFSRHVSGEIVGVERVMTPVMINNGPGVKTQDGQFSFAVAIRDASGIIHTASSEDRQWAIAHTGFCADAIFYPYPFWDLEKRGTYMNARLIQLRDCSPKSAAAGAPTDQALAPAATPAH